MVNAQEEPRTPWHLPLPITTPRTTLRLHTAGDAEDLLVFHSDAQVTRYLPWPVRDRSAVVQTLETKLLQTSLAAPDAWLSLAIESTTSGRVVGEALLHHLVPAEGAEQMVEVGYVLARPVQRRGLGSEVVSALIDTTWRHLPVCGVVAHVDLANDASRQLLTKLCFREDGPKSADNEELLRYVLPRPA